MRVVVTGPTGTIGRALIDALARDGHEVYAVCNPASARSRDIIEGGSVRKVLSDMSEFRWLPGRIGRECDAFFHLAWKGTTGAGRADMRMQNENVRCVLDAVDAASAMGCKVWLGAGSQAEYGRTQSVMSPDTPAFPENGYGIAKLCAGQMAREACQQKGLRYVWARLLSVYGPWDNPNSLVSYLVRTLLSGGIPEVTEACQEWDYLYCMDSAAALLGLAKSENAHGVYVVADGKHRKLSEYIIDIRDAIAPGRELRFGAVPYQDRQPMHLQADISKLVRATGFRPEYSFQKGIKQTADFWRGKNGREQ